MLPSASAPRQGGWEAEDREASLPVGDLRQDFSLPAPSSPPGSEPPRALAPRPAAGSRPRPAAVPGPPPHPAPSPGAQERLSPASLAPLGFGPAARERRLSLHLPLGASIQVSPRQPDPEAAAATTSSFSGGGGNHRSAGRPPARPREEPARDGTTQAHPPPPPSAARSLSRFPARGQKVRSTSRPDPAWPSLPGHWSAATGLTSLHRRPPRQPPAGQRVPAPELCFCRRLPLSPRRPRPTLRRAASGVCRQPRAEVARSCPALTAEGRRLPQLSPAGDRWARKSPTHAARPSGTSPRPVRARTRHSWAHPSTRREL
ncbi:basic proline-rich protein-like [Empidonax traillii]|uniref:basic proline-rich protein-like n=1 Tax=Empidonax traillii TaxID=164674 RepID=UPI000FFDB552|nr:basic proline-rich protein-like [Empidonax traillii]